MTGYAPGPQVRVELISGDKVIPVGSLSVDEPPGSLSGEDADGRPQVYIFGWHGDRPGLWISKGGFDMANKAIRHVVSIGLETVSDLSVPYDLCCFRNGQPQRLRFTLTGGEVS